MKARTTLGALPSEYRSDEIEAVVRDAVAQIDRRIDEIDESPPAGLPVVEIALPSAEKSIKLHIAPDFDRDFWTETTTGGVTYRGPRRIWKVKRITLPSDFEAGSAVRYRIVGAGAEFGVFSCRFLDELSNLAMNHNDQAGSRWEVTYGMVIMGIPNYLSGLPVRATTDYAGYPPGSVIGKKSGETPAFCTNTTALYEAAATEAFETNPETVIEAYQNHSVVPGWMDPDLVTTDYPDEVDGFNAMVITGKRAEEVYAQINSLQSKNLSWVSGQGHGPTAPAMDGGRARPAVPGNVAIRASASQMTVRTFGTLGASEAVVEGIPFLYRDCSAMAPRRNTFSVALTMRPSRILEWAQIVGGSGLMGASTVDQRPSMWHASGLKLQNTARRQAGIDLIVE